MCARVHKLRNDRSSREMQEGKEKDGGWYRVRGGNSPQEKDELYI
ncbi:hypothetical protein A2U01_0053586, partial [Trifolium medium]|nr:hypothetical protein [Trifolium medium]